MAIKVFINNSQLLKNLTDIEKERIKKEIFPYQALIFPFIHTPAQYKVLSVPTVAKQSHQVP